MVSTTVQTILLENLTTASFDNWTSGFGLAAENVTLGNVSHIPNITGFEDGPRFPSYIRTPSLVLCTIILCIGVLGNIMVPCVILKSKDMRNSTNIFLMNLSIADLMVLLVCTPTVLVEVNSKPETWQMGEHMCKAVPFVELTVAHASVLTILAISFERYYAICEPLKAGYVCTKTRAIVICLLAWGFAALFTSPITWITEYRSQEYYDKTIVPTCLTQVEKTWPATYFVLIILIFFILPLIILIVLYAIIAKNLMAEINSSDNNMYNQRARRQVVTMLALVVLSFFLCLLPFRIITLWIIIIPESNMYSFRKIGLINYYKLLYISRILIFVNSAINPILYNIVSSKFRKGFKKLIGIRHVNNRKFTYTGTLTTSLNSSHQSSTRRLLMTQKSTPNFYNDDSNSFKNKNLYRQSTDSMLFDRSKNKSLLMLKNSESFQARSKDIDELLRRTCRQCGHPLEEFCKHCRRMVSKKLLEQHPKAKKICHCEETLDKTGKNNYLYCKNCEVFVNNRVNKPKHSLDASLSTCSKLPINILLQTFESFDSSPLLLKKFNDEKQKLRKELEGTADDSKEVHQPLLERGKTCKESRQTIEASKTISRDYDNLTDIEEENGNSIDKENCTTYTLDTLSSSKENEKDLSQTGIDCIEMKEFDLKESEHTTLPKIPVTEADKKRDKFSSILKTGNRKLVTKKSNVSFDLENLNKSAYNSSNDSLNKFSGNLPERDPDKDANHQGRFSIRRTSTYDNVDPKYETTDQENKTNSVYETAILTNPICTRVEPTCGNNNLCKYHEIISIDILHETPGIEYDCYQPNHDKSLVNHEIHSKSNANVDTIPTVSNSCLPKKIKTALDNICDKQLSPQHSKNFQDCDNRSEQHFDEIRKKIQNSLQLLDSIAISSSSKDSSDPKYADCCNVTDNIPQMFNKKSRSLRLPQILNSLEPIVSTDQGILNSSIATMPTLKEELSPISPVCDMNYAEPSCSNKTLPSPNDVITKTNNTVEEEFHKLNPENSTGNLEPKHLEDENCSKCTKQFLKKVPIGSIDYSHCNGKQITSHHSPTQLDLKSTKRKFQYNMIKKMKNKKSYDDIRIEMKKRRSRKRPKLRRENSFDFGDLVPAAPDLLVPFSFSNSENNVKDLITSQSKSTNTATNNVLINLFELKDANEETFV
uniref:Growth hormone secretagogue receptor type 1 n=1 Tax=Cacopsylla melanoneura TaxID=428564 RepID=A0A8D8Y2G4_9HEMI